jgi:hypothetical protein
MFVTRFEKLEDEKDGDAFSKNSSETAAFAGCKAVIVNLKITKTKDGNSSMIPLNCKNSTKPNSNSISHTLDLKTLDKNIHINGYTTIKFDLLILKETSMKIKSVK